MELIKEIYKRNLPLARLGTANIIIAIALLIYLPFNHFEVLGINSMLKPIKFALSIAIMSYTLCWFLYYLIDKNKVKVYNIVTIIAMVFEQLAITFQAFRGQQSHFNISSTFGIIIFALMGIFILTFTIWTAYIVLLFYKQKAFNLHPTYLLAIRIGLILFVLFSLFGGYIAQRTGHTVGGKDGGKGLLFLNWSRFFGDLRIAHFFGIHSLQIIPITAFIFSKQFSINISKILLIIIVIGYTSFILFTMIQALRGEPFI
jgi:hypothetical protein